MSRLLYRTCYGHYHNYYRCSPITHVYKRAQYCLTLYIVRARRMCPSVCVDGRRSGWSIERRDRVTPSIHDYYGTTGKAAV